MGGIVPFKAPCGALFFTQPLSKQYVAPSAGVDGRQVILPDSI